MCSGNLQISKSFAELGIYSDADIIFILFRQEGLAYEVLQWYICRMEAWFAVDADMISLKCWDQVNEIFMCTLILGYLVDSDLLVVICNFLAYMVLCRIEYW